MFIISRIFFQMHSSDIKISQMPTGNYWIFILGNLKTFRNIWIKIILTVKFGKISNFTIYSKSNFYHILYCFFIDYWQSSRMGHTNRTNIYIWIFFIRIILTTTKHFCLCFQFRVYLKPNCRVIFFPHVFIIPFSSKFSLIRLGKFL